MIEPDIWNYEPGQNLRREITTDDRLNWLEDKIDTLTSSLEDMDRKLDELLERNKAEHSFHDDTHGTLFKLGVVILILLVFITLHLVGWI